jgi:hypothetical protein
LMVAETEHTMTARHRPNTSRAISTDVLHYLARVLVIQAARDC